MLIEYRTKPYYKCENDFDKLPEGLKEIQQMLYFTDKEDISFEVELNASSSQKRIFEEYQLDNEYTITSNMDVCNEIDKWSTTFSLLVCNHLNVSKAVKKEKICDRYNDCDNCYCGDRGCDCTKGDESEEACKGNVRVAFYYSIVYFIVVMILGCASFWLVKYSTLQRPIIRAHATWEKTDQATIKLGIEETVRDFGEDKNIEKEIIRKLNDIIKNEDGIEKQFVLDNLGKFQNLHKKRGSTNCKSTLYLKILKLAYALSCNQRYERACNKIVYMLYLNEYDLHKNRAEALKCLMPSKKELSYLSAWIYKVIEENDTFGGEVKGWLTHAKTFLQIYGSSTISVGQYYLDVTKDIATTCFFLHIYKNILKEIHIETRYVSVGQLNFERLFIYHLVIIISSQIFMYLRVLWKGCIQTGRNDDLHKIFNTENTCWRFLVYFFPIHFCLLEQAYLNHRIKKAKEHMNRMDHFNASHFRSFIKTDEKVSQEVLATSHELDILNRNLHYINQFYAELDILETNFERAPQLVIQTVLFIIANYYHRVLYLFDELLFIPITYAFILNWIFTILAITNSILRFRNAKRFPMSTDITGTILQKLALFILISGKIVFISAAVANMPYLHPIGPFSEIIIVFLFYQLITCCRGRTRLYTTVGIATTSAFYRPPAKPSKTLQTKMPMANNPDPETKTNEAKDKKEIKILPSENTHEVSLLIEKEQKSTSHSATASREEKQPNKVRMSLQPYMSLRANGGILSTLILEIISITIYFLIGKLARYLRKLEGLEIDEIAKLEELKEEGKEVQRLFAPLVHLIFVDVGPIYIVAVIGVLVLTFTLYLSVVYFYYNWGHPKRLILQNIAKIEPIEEISNQLKEHLDLISSDIQNRKRDDGNLEDDEHKNILKNDEIIPTNTKLGCEENILKEDEHMSISNNHVATTDLKDGKWDEETRETNEDMNINMSSVNTLDNTNDERSRNSIRSNQAIKISNECVDALRNSNNKREEKYTEEDENRNMLSNKENTLSTTHNKQDEGEREVEPITANYIKFIWKRNSEMGKSNFR